jgi:hypothetical protein
VIITAGDVLLLLALQRFGMRKIEAVVLVLVSTIAVCYFIEIFVIPQTNRVFWRWAAPDRPPRRCISGRRGCWSGHRDHRRDGDAAQSVSAFGIGAEPQVAAR